METKVKNVSAVFDPPAPHMVGDGFRVHNFFPGNRRLQMSPFYLLDYNATTVFSAREQPRGVGVHPHRGFETVTIAYQGAVAHHDSAGNRGVIYPGDVQWMTAGRGILHKEYHEQEYSLRGGPFQMVQLWVNLPARYKMTEPGYQGLKGPELPRYTLADGLGEVEIIAGEYKGIQGGARTFSPLHVFNARLKKAALTGFNFPFSDNTGMLVITGSIRINGTTEATSGQFAYFEHDGAEISVEALEDSVVLILSGEPINEPVAQYGPFLMNTQEELQQALADYNEGRFGYLE